MDTIKKGGYFFLVALLFFGLSFIIKLKVILFVLSAFVLAKFFSKKKYQIIAGFNVLGWFLIWSLFDKKAFTSIVDISNEYSVIFLKLITLLLVYTGFYFFHKKANKFQKEIFPLWIVIFCIITVGSAVLFPNTKVNVIWKLWLIVLPVVISCSIYFFVLIREKSISLIKILYIYPFWGNFLPVPGSYEELKKTENQNKNKTELRGLLSIYFWLIVVLALDLIKVIFLKTYYSGTVFLFTSLSDLQENKFFFNLLNYVETIENNATYHYVVRPILYFTTFILEVSAMIGLQVGLLMVFGFSPMNSITDFWRSKNFLDFFKKINTYYSHFLFLCFVLPTFSMFAFVKEFKLRVAASIFVSVFAWSTFYQFLLIQGVRWTEIEFSKFNFEGVYRIFLYNLMIATFLAASAVLIENSSKKAGNKKTVFFVRGWIYYSIYAWLGYYFLILGYQSLNQISSSLKMPMPINYLRSIVEIKNFL